MADISTQLIEQVRQAHAMRTQLQISGNGSKSFFGRRAAGQPLSLARHQGVVEYEPTELVVCARAGTTIEELDDLLAGDSQYLGCEPPRAGNATLGGSLACNRSGPARPWVGSIRDHVLGLRLINGKAEHLEFGGRVMKNVAGYDVSRLQAGAMGCLGIITEVTLRVFPIPETRQTILLELPAQAALDLMNRESAKGGPLDAACWVHGRAYLRFSGCRPAVLERCRKLGGERVEEGSALWSDLGELRHEFFAGDEPLWRLGARSAASPVDPDSMIDWGGSQRWIRGGTKLSAKETQASKLGGQASLYRGGNRDGEVFHSRTDAQKRVHLALKQAFDPRRLFNPGRLYGWL